MITRYIVIADARRLMFNNNRPTMRYSIKIICRFIGVLLLNIKRRASATTIHKFYAKKTH